MTQDQFEAFVSTRYTELVGRAMKVLRNWADAEDAVQEVLLSASRPGVCEGITAKGARTYFWRAVARKAWRLKRQRAKRWSGT